MQTGYVDTSSSDSGIDLQTFKSESRSDNSLGVLTTKFVSLLQTAENQCIDLNEASKFLGVQKRRIYDITNVLEGIGLICKKNKNIIQWVGKNFVEPSVLTSEFESLIREEQRLDDWIGKLENDIRELTCDEENSKFIYATYEDIKKLCSDKDDVVIAVSAPSGSILEIPDPESFPDDEVEKYQVYLHSHTGDISVDFTENNEETVKLTNQNSVAELFL